MSEPAFPYREIKEQIIGIPIEWNNYKGMTLRDYFAIHAPKGEIFVIAEMVNSDYHKEIAAARYAYADAMLSERNKQ